MPYTDWTYYYNKYGATNSICGLGKEQASIKSYSFVSLAYQNFDIPDLIYSFEIYPHLQQFSSANTFRTLKQLAEGETPKLGQGHALQHEKHLGKLPYKFPIEEELSYLTLGGWDKKDNSTEIVWYNTTEGGDSWNMTSGGMWIGDTLLNPSGDAATPPIANFQIGNPYLGLAQGSWETYKNLVNGTWNSDYKDKFRCNTWQNNEFCYWRNLDCSNIDIPANFTVQLGD